LGRAAITGLRRGDLTTQDPGLSDRPQTLAVITPLANERATIDQFVRRILVQLAPHDRLFTIFDTSCTDGTLQRARELEEHEPRLTVIYAPENTCVVDAYFRGYKEALAANVDWILEIDGGLSHLPEQIPQFVQAMSQGYDFAGGSRFIPSGSFDGPWSRYLVSRGGTWLTNLLLGTKMHDMTSGFECFTRAALARVVAEGVQSRAHFFQTEIRAAMHDYRWIEIPIRYACPSSSVGKSSLLDAFKVLWSLYRRRKRGVA
jgi:dolichol-phosphate mannosyltransferase